MNIRTREAKITITPILAIHWQMNGQNCGYAVKEKIDEKLIQQIKISAKIDEKSGYRTSKLTHFSSMMSSHVSSWTISIFCLKTYFFPLPQNWHQYWHQLCLQHIVFHLLTSLNLDWWASRFVLNLTLGAANLTTPSKKWVRGVIWVNLAPVEGGMEYLKAI